MARQRGGLWQADASVAGKRYRQDGFSTEAEALHWEGQTIAAVKAGKPLPPTTPTARGRASSITLKDAVARTARRFWLGKACENNALRNADFAIEFFGANKPLGDLTRADIEEWVEHLRATTRNSDATINRKLAALSKTLSYAFALGLIDRMPSFQGVRLEEHNSRHREVTDEEEALMLQTLTLWGMTDFKDLVVTLLDTGMRVGEATSLVDARVRMREGLIVLTADVTKTKRTRSLPMSDRVVEVMQRRLGTGAPFGGITQSQIRHSWDRMKAHMGLAEDDGFVPHALRHTCASRLVQNGVDLYTVQRWLGHTNSQMTMRYAHLAPKQLMSGVEAINRINAARSLNPQRDGNPSSKK